MRKRLIVSLVFGLLFGVASAQTGGGMASGGMMSGGATAAGSFVETGDGARIYYEVHGEGEPLVLVHGYPLNGRLFRDNVGPLSEGFQVITLDLRGYGQSETPSSEGSIATYAADVFAVMDEVGVDQAIIGECRWTAPSSSRCTARPLNVFAG